MRTEGYSMSTGGIRVQVSPEDVEAARELIEAKPEQTD